MKHFGKTLLFIALFAVAAAAQVPLDVEVKILRAEDELRFDADLTELLKHKVPAVRQRAALAAGRIGDAAAVGPLVELLAGDPAVEVRAMAAFALGEVESIEAADAIQRAIGETGKAKLPNVVEADIRGRLAEAAGKIAAANAKDPKAKDLGQAILFVLEAEHLKGADQNKETVLLALTAALRARPEKTDVTVAKFLTNSDARIRIDAANTLSRVRAKNANEQLRKMLSSDADAVARANAARALGASDDKTATDLLIKAATSDVDSRVRVSAVRSLAQLKDAKAAEALIAHGTKVLAGYKSSMAEGIVPAEHSEFVEVAVALGQIIPGSFNEAALKLFKDFAALDKGATSEVYVARVRVAPARGEGNAPELTSWKQYRTLAMIVGEFAVIEPKTEEGKKLKSEAAAILEPLARAMAEADPKEDADAIMAAPATLSAFARFGTDSLDEILRLALRNPDVQIRAAAASLLGDRPVADANLDVLKNAAEYAIMNDPNENDAALAAMNALFKLNKTEALSVLDIAAGSPDNLIRRRVHQMLNDEAYKGRELSPILKNIDRTDLLRVRRYSGKGTRLGQVLNNEADYRRAAARRNGSVKAVLTTKKGTFTIDLLPDDAPLTVDNFIRLANSKYFDGLEVHRVVPNFVMQDGDPRGDGTGGPGWTIRCEVNMVPYGRGTVGMALAGKDTGGSQWFVTHSPQPHLDGGYTVFGQVSERDMAVVDRIVQGDKILTVRIVGR